MHICCRVKNRSKNLGLISQTLVQNKSQKLVQDVLFIFPSFIVFLVCLNSQIVCRGAKIVFSQNCRDVKNDVFETKKAFFVFCLFYVEERQRETEENTKTGKLQKIAQKNCVLGVGGEKDGNLLKLAFSGELQNIVCFGRWKKAFSLTLSVPSLVFKITKHYKNWGFSGHMGKPKIHFLFEKGVFLEGVSKGLVLSVIHKSCVLLKTLLQENRV